MLSNHDLMEKFLTRALKPTFIPITSKWLEIMTLIVIVKFLTRALKTTFISITCSFSLGMTSALLCPEKGVVFCLRY